MQVMRGAKQQGHPLLRPLRPRLGDPRDPRPAAAGLPDAHLLATACSSAPARSAGRACSATSTSAPRRASAGSPPRSTARSSTTSATSWPARPTPFVKPPRAGDVRRLRGAGLRAGRPAARRPRRAAAGRWRSRRSCSATAPTPTSSRSPRTRSRPPSRSSTCAAAGSAASAAGSSTRSRTSTPASWSSDFLLQLYGGEAGDAIPREVLVPALPDDADAVEQLARRRCAAPGRDPGAAARRQAGPAGDRRPQRRAGAGAAQDQAGQRPDHPQPGAGGDPGGARAGRGAAADRVLRHLQPPGHRRGRLDGGLRGRPGPQERVPPVRDQGRRRPERRRLDARGDHPAVPAAARRAGASPASSTATRRRRERARCWSTPRPAGRASSPTRPSLVVVDGGPPQVAAAAAGARRARHRRRRRRAAWPSGSRRSGCPARRTR